jgi:TnsA endonuclease-like protein
MTDFEAYMTTNLARPCQYLGSANTNRRLLGRPFEQESILLIRGADTHVMRVRTVVTRSRARSTGKYPSWKMGRMVQWESPAELNACRLLDADPAVTAFYEQPLEITYSLDGEVHRHYPDILVLVPNRSELWKIKSEAARPETVRRTELMRRALTAYGYTF